MELKVHPSTLTTSSHASISQNWHWTLRTSSRFVRVAIKQKVICIKLITEKNPLG
jgi:hypothetical protein